MINKEFEEYPCPILALKNPYIQKETLLGIGDFLNQTNYRETKNSKNSEVRADIEAEASSHKEATSNAQTNAQNEIWSSSC